MPNNLVQSYEVFLKAYKKLSEFIKTDEGTEKDIAAIIHAYEYTFELWWKFLQRYLEDYETMTEHGPGATIRNAFQFGILAEGQPYMDMLRDRNLIAHTYKEDVAKEIYQRIVESHYQTLNDFVEKFNNKIS